MTIRSDFSIDWEVSPRIITIASPSTSVIMQDLLDTLRSEESSGANMDDDSIVDAAGKENLGEGVRVGLTVTLLNAKIAFEARGGPTYIQCTALGGNLVALDDVGGDISPVYPTAFTQVVRASSSSATLIEDLSSQELSNAVWDETLSLHLSGGSTGEALDKINKNTGLIPATV